MEISILLTILLIKFLLGGAFTRGRKICLIEVGQTTLSPSIKFNLKNSLSNRVVKLVLKRLYLLNIVILIDAQKAAQTTQIQPQNLTFEG